ncbi:MULTISPECIES: porin [Burkholderia]|uniref:Porin n=1 Tax=Burkholderia sola TaxID=2843302 RepID=A0ABV2CFD4_9BURK|nr:porin [Burkholderia sp. CpTa8-5]MBP0609484.1 porin [Burkholderia sp. CpTa8-5]
MKRKMVLAMAAVTMAGGANAQSSVTLFGTLGGGVRWVDGLKGGHQLGFDSNIISGNSFGLKGTEDLGQGLKAIFTLQSGFVTGTGGLASASSPLFSKAAYVGLGTDAWRVTLGRQLNAAEDVGVSLDPDAAQGTSLAIVPGVVWVGNFFTLDSRFNNVVKIVGKTGGLTLRGSYSVGGVAGNTRAGSNLAVGATYQYQTLMVGAAYQKTYNATASQWAQSAIGGATWQLGPAKLYLSYSGLWVTAPTSAGIERRDDIPAVGLVYRITPFLEFSTATYYDIARNLKYARGSDGRKLTTYAMFNYFLSKRTQLYVEYDRNGFSGAYKRDPANVASLNLRPDGKAVTGMSVGMITQF